MKIEEIILGAVAGYLIFKVLEGNIWNTLGAQTPTTGMETCTAQNGDVFEWPKSFGACPNPPSNPYILY